MICTVTDSDFRVRIFSRGDLLVLYDETKGEIVLKKKNPALDSPMKRPIVAKECIRIGADKVLAAHGSLCFPSYRMVKKAGIKMLITDDGSELKTTNYWNVNWKEVMYSSFLAMTERIKGHD